MVGGGTPGATARQRMAAYDRLPLRLRKFLAYSPIQWNAILIEDMVGRRGVEGVVRYIVRSEEAQRDEGGVGEGKPKYGNSARRRRRR